MTKICQTGIFILNYNVSLNYDQNLSNRHFYIKLQCKESPHTCLPAPAGTCLPCLPAGRRQAEAGLNGRATAFNEALPHQLVRSLKIKTDKKIVGIVPP